MDVRRLMWLSCLAAACGGALPAAAGAAGWSTQSDVGGVSAAVGVPRVAIDAGGSATLIWNRSNGSANDVQTLFHPAGSSGWSGQTGLSRGGTTFSPQVATGADGTTFAIWRWLEPGPGGKYRIQVAARPPGGGWGLPQVISTAGRTAYAPSIAVSRSGSVAAIWARGADNDTLILETAFRSRGGSWVTEGDIGTADVSVETPQAGMDALGNSAYLWLSGGSVQASYRPDDGYNSGGYSELTPSGGGPGSGQPHLAVGEDGTAVAVWVSSGSGLQSIGSEIKHGSGAWEDGGLVSRLGPFAGSPTVAVDPQGNAVAAWVESFNSGNANVIRAATRPAGRGWGESVLVSDVNEGPASPRLAVDASGNAHLAWINAAGAVREATLASIASRIAWSTPITLSSGAEAASDLSIAASAGGQAVAAWVGTRGANATVDTAVLDSAGPRLDAAVASTATAGVPLGFAGSAADDWSPIAGAAWDFGDGTSAAGLTVQHAYARPGTYTATLRASDSVGNPAVPLTRSVTVVPPTLVTLAKAATTRIRWTRSRLRASLRLTVNAAVPGRARITLTAAGAKKPRLTRTVKLKAGSSVVTLRLPASTPPGVYTVRVTLAGQTSSRNVRVASPREGVVSRAYIGRGAGGLGSPVLLNPSSGVHAVFRFSALPAAGQRIVAVWRTPGRGPLEFARLRSRVVDSFLRIDPPAPGRWTCELRVGKVIVKTVAVTVR